MVPNTKRKSRKRRKHARKMFGLASQVIRKLLLEGGRVAIEWPADSGWRVLPEVQQFERDHGFRRVYFHGCMLGVHGVSKPIKKPWCVSSCDERILKALAEYQCDGSHEHEPAEEKFVSVILGPWYPQRWFTNVPDLSSVSALVAKNLSKTQWLKDDKAIKAVEKESLGLRSNGTWDDTTVIIPLHLLKHRARETGENVSIAEVLMLAGIKHHEMPEEYHQYKGRIVYRGDRITNQMGDHVFFSENETATTPTAIAALNLTLWHGAMSIVSCADCIQAYLQCKLDGDTWVILPFELWLPEWKKQYHPNTKLAVKLIKSQSGHPQSGNLLHFFSRHNCKKWLASHSNHTRPILFSSKVTTLNTRSSKTSMWMILPEEGGTRTSKQNFGRS